MCIVRLVSGFELFPVLYIWGKGRAKHFCKVGWVECLKFFLQTNFLFFLNISMCI